MLTISSINFLTEIKKINVDVVINIKKIAAIINKKLSIKEHCYFDLSFINEMEIKKINNKYRHINKSTDVISFALRDAKTTPNSSLLGEIFVCPGYINNHLYENFSFDEQILYVCIHGILHLLGYDHINKIDEKKMNTLQDSIFNNLLKVNHAK